MQEKIIDLFKTRDKAVSLIDHKLLLSRQNGEISDSASRGYVSNKLAYNTKSI